MNNEITNKHLECLGKTETVASLWDEMVKEFNPSKTILFVRQGTIQRFRIIGPLFPVGRKYIPNISQLFTMPKDLLKAAIYDGDDAAVYELRKKMQSQSVGQKQKDATNNFLSSGWSNVLYCNVIVRESGTTLNGFGEQPQQSGFAIKIFEVTSAFLNAVSEFSCNMGDQFPLSGVVAHDVFATKKGQGLQSQWKVQLSPKPIGLFQEEVAGILQNGLFDIPPLLKSITKKSIKNGKGYIYKFATDEYKMPNNVNKWLMKEIARYQEDNYIKQIEDSIDNLPPEAFIEDDADTDIDSFSYIEID